MASVIRGNDNFDSAIGGSTTYGGVGTYGLFHWPSAGIRNPGDTIAGSSIYPASSFDDSGSYNGYSSASGHPSGTWRLMGQTGRMNGTTTLTRADNYASVFVRIS